MEFIQQKANNKKKLTPFAAYQRKKEYFIEQGHNIVDEPISLTTVYLLCSFIASFSIIFTALLYAHLWPAIEFEAMFGLIFDSGKIIATYRHIVVRLILAMIAVYILSGGILACYWNQKLPGGWKHIRFSLLLKRFNFYGVFCREALDVKTFSQGLRLPFCLLGIIPAALSIITGSPVLLLLGWIGLYVGSYSLGFSLLVQRHKRTLLLLNPMQRVISIIR